MEGFQGYQQTALAEKANAVLALDATIQVGPVRKSDGNQRGGALRRVKYADEISDWEQQSDYADQPSLRYVRAANARRFIQPGVKLLY